MSNNKSLNLKFSDLKTIIINLIVFLVFYFFYKLLFNYCTCTQCSEVSCVVSSCCPAITEIPLSIIIISAIPVVSILEAINIYVDEMGIIAPLSFFIYIKIALELIKFLLNIFKDLKSRNSNPKKI